MGLGTRKLAIPKQLYNVDNTTNRVGQVTHYVDLDIRTNNIHKEMRFLVSDIGCEDAILGVTCTLHVTQLGYLVVTRWPSVLDRLGDSITSSVTRQ
jgi:hypothetical protein